MPKRFQIAFAIITVALIVFNVITWFGGILSPDAAIFSQNLLWGIASLFIAGIYIWRRKKLTGESRWLATGIIFVAIGTGVHRLYYSVWRWFRVNEYESLQAAQLDYAWVLTLPIGLALLGYAFHAKPLMEDMFGAFWLWAYLGVVVWSWSFFSWFVA